MRVRFLMHRVMLCGVFACVYDCGVCLLLMLSRAVCEFIVCCMERCCLSVVCVCAFLFVRFD